MLFYIFFDAVLVCSLYLVSELDLQLELHPCYSFTLAKVRLSSYRTISASMRSSCYDLYKHKLLVSKQVKNPNCSRKGASRVGEYVCCNVYSDPPSFSLDLFLTNYISSNPRPSYFMTIPLSCVVLFGLRSGWSRAIASSGTHLWSYRISSVFVSLQSQSRQRVTYDPQPQ